MKHADSQLCKPIPIEIVLSKRLGVGHSDGMFYKEAILPHFYPRGIIFSHFLEYDFLGQLLTIIIKWLIL